MGETTDQIERQIRVTRNSLSENIGELQDRFKKSVDWRVQVAERPGTMLALAFGGGILLSAALPAMRRTRRARAYSDSGHDLAQQPTRATSESTRTDHAGEPQDPLSALKGALVAVAISKANTFIGDLLPGFNREFATAKRASQDSSVSSENPSSAGSKSDAVDAA